VFNTDLLEDASKAKPAPGVLEFTGRWAHSAAYVEQVVKKAGLEVVKVREKIDYYTLEL
jgi:predicted TPR repeat methyltransferase